MFEFKMIYIYKIQDEIKIFVIDLTARNISINTLQRGKDTGPLAGVVSIFGRV